METTQTQVRYLKPGMLLVYETGMIATVKTNPVQCRARGYVRLLTEDKHGTEHVVNCHGTTPCLIRVER